MVRRSALICKCLCLVLHLHISSSACPVHAGRVAHPGDTACNSSGTTSSGSSLEGIALLQQRSHVQQTEYDSAVAGQRLEAELKTIVFDTEAVSIKLWLPSWFTIFTLVLFACMFFTTVSGYCWYKDNQGAGCVCSGICAALLILLAVALVIMKIYLMRMAGPEPAGPAVQAPIATEVVVDTVIPFKSAEINKPGPVRTAYIEGMQNALDKKSPGAVKVVDVKASSAPTALLIQGKATSLLENRVSLVYTLSPKNATKKAKKGKKGEKAATLPHASASDLEAGVQEAAKKAAGKKTGKALPKALKEVAGGSQPAVTKTEVAVKVNANFRCKAEHKLNEDIRAIARSVAKKHSKDILRELEHFAQRKLAGFRLKLADRCNEAKEEDAMQVCLGPDALWIDYVTEKAVSVPKHEDSVESFLCKAGCKLGKALSDETAKVIAEANSQLQGVEMDKTMLSKILCTPSLPKGRDCDSSCT